MIEIINQITQEKIERNRSPTFALYGEIIREAAIQGISAEEARKGLRALLNAGKITLGRTINDYWIIENDIH